MKILHCDSCHVEVNDYANWYNDEKPRNMYELNCIHENNSDTFNGMIFCHECIERLLQTAESKETVTEFADRCRECGAKYGKLLKQKLCEDVVSRRAVYEIINDAYFLKIDDGAALQESVKQLPSVSPQPAVGRWIYDKNIDNWRCSECGETPKTMGYCGAAAFMAEHFKYCNHCGAKMQEVEE